ncbi:hypothetical protein Plhal703r1_c39g0136171 [Plasmopara halstedii]
MGVRSVASMLRGPLEVRKVLFEHTKGDGPQSSFEGPGQPHGYRVTCSTHTLHTLFSQLIHQMSDMVNRKPPPVKMSSCSRRRRLYQKSQSQVLPSKNDWLQ